MEAKVSVNLFSRLVDGKGSWLIPTQRGLYTTKGLVCASGMINSKDMLRQELRHPQRSRSASTRLVRGLDQRRAKLRLVSASAPHPIPLVRSSRMILPM